MKELLLIFDKYYYDFENQVVNRLLKGDKIKPLKWAHPNPKYPDTERVTLYREKKPIYVFKKDFKKTPEGKCLIIKDKELNSKSLEKKEEEQTIEEEVDSFVQEQEVIIKYFHEKQNEPTKKEELIKKFGKEKLERNIDMLIVVPGFEDGTYYRLTKRFYI